jgi:hypothetical protein
MTTDTRQSDNPNGFNPASVRAPHLLTPTRFSAQ